MPIIQLAEYRSEDIHETLEDLVRRASAGRLLGMAFVVRTGAHRHRFGIVGTYRTHPGDALAGATRLEYKLNELLDHADSNSQDTSAMGL